MSKTESARAEVAAPANDPSPHSLGEFLLAQINPIQQFKIAKEAAENPGFLSHHPQDLLLPSVLIMEPTILAAETAGKVGMDCIHVIGDQFDALGDGLGVVRDLGKTGLDIVTLDLADVPKDFWNAVKHFGGIFVDEWHAVKDAFSIIPDVLSPITGRLWEAGKDIFHGVGNILGDGWDALKESVGIVTDGLGLVRDTGKTLLDIATLDFGSAIKDGGNALHHAWEEVKHPVNIAVDGVKAVGHAASGAFHAIADLL